MKAYDKKNIILFDGVCNLCNKSAQFILKHDKKKHFLFASLQSDAAVNLLLQFNSNISNLSSIILIENGKVYEKSTAVLRIARNLSPVWNLFYYFIFLPIKFRDYLYDFVARNRYRWFGKSEHCLINTPQNANRFI